MSITYSVDVKLDVKYSPANILRVLKEGAAMDFVYYQYISDENPVVDFAKAVDIFLATDPDSGDKFMNVIFQDTNFLLWFFESCDGFLEISIGAFGVPWRADFRDKNRMIHLARYIRLLLRLCKNSIVLELKTDDM